MSEFKFPVRLINEAEKRGSDVIRLQSPITNRFPNCPRPNTSHRAPTRPAIYRHVSDRKPFLVYDDG